MTIPRTAKGAGPSMATELMKKVAAEKTLKIARRRIQRTNMAWLLSRYSEYPERIAQLATLFKPAELNLLITAIRRRRIPGNVNTDFFYAMARLGDFRERSS